MAENRLSSEFLKELFNVAGRNKQVTAILAEHLKEEFLPDKEYIALFKSIKAHYIKYKDVVSNGALYEKHKSDDDTVFLIDEISKTEYVGTYEALIDELETFIKRAKFLDYYEKLGSQWKRKLQEEAIGSITELSEWINSFSLKATAFDEIIDEESFEDAHEKAKLKAKEVVKGNQYEPKFYIDYLDELNGGRSLRGQVVAFLAGSGVGKSRVLKHIGLHSALDNGYVLHIQLEGSGDEATDAYRSAIIGVNSYHFQQGSLSEGQVEQALDVMGESDGSLKVRSFPKFGNNISTNDIRNAIEDFKKSQGDYPDSLVIDYVDVIGTDSSGRAWKPSDERHKRLKVLEDLKDLATEYNICVFTAIQSGILDKEFINNPENVLTRYNSGEGKGIVKPMTWYLTLNRTFEEYKNNRLRIHIDKTRFTEGEGDDFTIATDYGREIFYDRDMSLTLN